MKTAWILGASSGIGLAMSQNLARRGWRVLMSARRKELLDEHCRQWQGDGELQAFPCDVTDYDWLQATAAAIKASVGELDLCVLNAGVFKPMSAKAFDVAEAQRQLTTNLGGVINGLGVALPMMRAEGQIIVTASVAGYRGLPNGGPYCASKAGLIALCESLQPQLRDQQIHLRVLNPGFVRTPMTANNRFPMPFLLDVEDAAERAVTAILHKRSFEITFPRRLSWTLKLLRLLPARAYLALLHRLGRHRADRSDA